MKNTTNIVKFKRIVFVLLAGIPVLAGILYAFLYSIGIFGVLNNGLSSNAWALVLTDISFWKSIAFSMYIGITSVSVSSILSFLLAYWWRENFKSGILSVVIYLPLCFPATVMAFFTYQMLSQSGFVSRIAFLFDFTEGISTFPEFINDPFGIGIILTMVALISPFLILLFSNTFQSEKIEELSAIAATLGASKKQIISRIIIPTLFKKNAASLLLFIVFVMGNYEVPLLLGRQNPQMIAVAIVQKIQRYNLYDIPKGYVMSIIYVGLLLVALGIIAFKNPQFFKTKDNND